MTTKKASLVRPGLAVTLAVLAMGCSSPPRPVLPDGSNRVPVNHPERRAEFEAASKVAAEERRARDASDKRLTALERELDRVRMGLVAMATLKDAPAPPALSQAAKASDDGAIETRGRSVVFRVRFDFGSTAFAPPTPLERQLVAAAASGTHIEVRGRTDGVRATPGETAVARSRANEARTWLLRQGVDPKRIRATWLAAGGHWTLNDTAAGRALNRRVEIEVMDVDQAVLVAACCAGRAP